MEEETILVVDDDKEIVNVLQKLLEAEGYQVLCAYDGLEALDKLTSHTVHLILLDIMMPKLNGLAAIMKIREKKGIPIIVLSAKTEESDKVLGLTMGADDYIDKPFNTGELLARVQSQLRRYLRWGTKKEEEEKNCIVVGNLVLDRDSKEAIADGKKVKLTATEYKIVELLMKHPGRVFSAEEIYRIVWQEEAYSVENTVMVHIRRIREKLEINPKVPKYLKVVWGIGYKVEKF